jgi:hypothetical protein
MAMSLHDIPGLHYSTVSLPAVASGASTTLMPIWAAPFDARLIEVEMVLGTALAGHDDNRFNFNVISLHGTAAAEIGNLDIGTGTAFVAYTPKSLYSGGTSPIEISEGRVVAIQYEKASAGFNVPPAIVTLKFRGA